MPDTTASRRLLLAAFSALLPMLLVSLVMPVASAAEATTEPVDGVSLRWGLSNEANNSAFAPGTHNFFSAGKVPDPGQGGSTLTRADWRQRVGTVAIEKWSGSAWRPATWEGLSTTPDGTALGGPTNGRFSNHQMVLSDGVGTLDTEAGTAQISWTGDVTVLFYSGMSFFYISDPVLDVADGRGRLTGTLSGFASSQTDTSLWEPVAPRQVTLADLAEVQLEPEGFTATPAYAGVRVTGVPQDTTGAATGSFPQSWVDFMGPVGTAAYWYSSGGSTDAFKAALPITVGIGASPPTPAPSAQPTVPEVDNSAPPPPSATSRPTTSGSTTSTGMTTAGIAPPPVNGLLPALPAGRAAGVPAGQPRAPVSAPHRLTAVQAKTNDPSSRWWVAGSLLFGLAVLLLLGPALAGRRALRRAGRTPAVQVTPQPRP